jgi:hypothetical protein
MSYEHFPKKLPLEVFAVKIVPLQLEKIIANCLRESISEEEAKINLAQILKKFKVTWFDVKFENPLNNKVGCRKAWTIFLNGKFMMNVWIFYELEMLLKNILAGVRSKRQAKKIIRSALISQGIQTPETAGDCIFVTFAVDKKTMRAIIWFMPFLPKNENMARTAWPPIEPEIENFINSETLKALKP